jgi:hypothetical protein
VRSVLHVCFQWIEGNTVRVLPWAVPRSGAGRLPQRAEGRVRTWIRKRGLELSKERAKSLRTAMGISA